VEHLVQSPSTTLQEYLGKAAHRTIDEAEIFLSDFLEDYAARKTTAHTVISLDAIASISNSRRAGSRQSSSGDGEEDNATWASGSDSDDGDHVTKGKS